MTGRRDHIHLSGLHTAVLVRGARPPALTALQKLPGFQRGTARSALWRWPGRDILGGCGAAIHPSRELGLSLEQKAWWINVLDWRVMETKEQVRRHSRQAPFGTVPSQTRTHMHTQCFATFLKGSWKPSMEEQQNLTDQHLPRMIPQGGLGLETQCWPHIQLLKHLQHVHPWVAQDRLLRYSLGMSLRIKEQIFILLFALSGPKPCAVTQSGQ